MAAEQWSDYFDGDRGKSRNWVFTLNNWSEQEVEDILKEFESRPKVLYLVFGKEIGKQGTPHLQGFVRFENGVGMNAVKGFIGRRAHVEKAKLPHNAIEYCMKDGNVTERGVRPQFQKNQRATDAAKTAKEGKNAMFLRLVKEKAPVMEMIENCPTQFLQYCNKLPLLRQQMDPTGIDWQQKKCLWLWGESGIGKSRMARDIGKQYSGTFVKDAETKWWDGFGMDECVIVDDVDPSHSHLFHLLKIWADGYPFQGEYKGGYMKIHFKCLIVTSQYPIDHVFQVSAEAMAAMTRRFESIHVTETYVGAGFPTCVGNVLNIPTCENETAQTALVDLYANEELELTATEIEFSDEDLLSDYEQAHQEPAKKRRKVRGRAGKDTDDEQD